MKSRKPFWMGLLVLGCSWLSGGCVDAITDGAAVGLRDSIAAVISTAFETALQGLPGGE